MKFKLEPVLSLRENVEQIKKKELGIATTQKQGLEDHKEILIDKKDNILDLVRFNVSNKVDVDILKQLRSYSKQIDCAIQRVDGDIVKAEYIVTKKKIELAEAMKQRKVLEKLKELKKEQYAKEQSQREAMLVDELVSYKYAVKIQ